MVCDILDCISSEVVEFFYNLGEQHVHRTLIGYAYRVIISRDIIYLYITGDYLFVEIYNYTILRFSLVSLDMKEVCESISSYCFDNRFKR